jgi:hypothetical protein
MNLVRAYVNCELTQGTCDDIMHGVPAVVTFLPGMNHPTLARVDWMDAAAAADDDRRSVSR